MADSDQHHLAYDAQEIRPGVWRHSRLHDPITSSPRSAHEHEHVRGPAAEAVAVPDHHDPARERRPATVDAVLDDLHRHGYAIVDRSDPDGSPDPLPC